MRRIGPAALFFTAVLSVFGPSVSGQTVAGSPQVRAFDELKGEDWPRMTDEERQRFVYTGIGGLERQGVFVTRPPSDYLEALGRILQDPAMAQEYLDNIFVFSVYDAEPQTRAAIERIRAESKSGPEGA